MLLSFGGSVATQGPWAAKVQVQVQRLYMSDTDLLACKRGAQGSMSVDACMTCRK